MKFKLIFILFNAIIVVSFLFIFFLPYFILGWDYTELFWSRNWFLAALFLVVLFALNTYFIANWKLFSFLEREDWPKLIEYLEEKIFQGNRTRAQEIRILINTYVVTSQPERIEKLEAYLREHKPKLVKRFAVPFGIPYLVRNDADEMEQYYGGLMKDPDSRDHAWLVWNYAFALLMQQRTEEAKGYLLQLKDDVKNPVLYLLTLYLLDPFTKQDESIAESVESGKQQLRDKYGGTSWQKEIDKNRDNLEVIVLARLVRDATAWAFRPTAATA